MEEEDIDNETLQAKVDASLAYVNDLVSSWMKPPKNPSSSRKDVEKEIEQLMRRPPRLGVGAQPPESSAGSGREAGRLKGMLVGAKKRARDDDRHPEKVSSDNEDESRTGAIKKKAKLDLLDSGTKRKKLKVDGNAITTPHNPPGFHRHSSSLSDSIDVDKKQVESPSIAETLSHKSQKKKRRKQGRDGEAPVRLGPPGIADTINSNLFLQSNATTDTILSPKITQSIAENPVGDHEETEDTPSLSSTSKHFTKSVLNLDGPPVDSIDSNQSPKKKRKKRKKKKHHGEPVQDGVP